MSPRTTKTTADLVAASILLAAMATVTACSASPSPNITPPVPTTAPAPTGAPVASTPTATPSPSATWPPQMERPTPPPEMSRDDEAGAVAAATYFLGLYAHTEVTQDTVPWQAMSHPDCVFCKSVLDDVAAQRAADQVTLAAPIRINQATVESLNALTFSVTADISTGPDERFTADGLSISRTAENGGTVTIILVHGTAGWIVRGVDLEKRT